ncbi:MAG: PHP domain-containing protein [Candidatus Absconditabacteria bacterium]
MYVHLHGHSTFSFLEAIGKPNKISAQAKKLGMEAIALTDYNGMYGAIKFIGAAKDDDIKPILGVELGFVLDINTIVQPDQIGNVVLIAISDIGYAHLMELISYANTLGIKGKPKIDLATLQKYGEGLLIFFGGVRSWVNKMLMRDEKVEKIYEIITMIQNTLGQENVYLEIVAQDHILSKDIAQINQFILQTAQHLSIPCIVNTDYHYIEASDKLPWEAALAIKDGKKMYDQDRRQSSGYYHIMSEEEIRAILIKNGYDDVIINDWIGNNIAIADRVHVKVKLGQTLFPNYSTPEDIRQLYDLNKEQLIVSTNE